MLHCPIIVRKPHTSPSFGLMCFGRVDWDSPDFHRQLCRSTDAAISEVSRAHFFRSSALLCNLELCHAPDSLNMQSSNQGRAEALAGPTPAQSLSRRARQSWRNDRLWGCCCTAAAAARAHSRGRRGRLLPTQQRPGLGRNGGLLVTGAVVCRPNDFPPQTQPLSRLSGPISAASGGPGDSRCSDAAIEAHWETRQSAWDDA